MGHDTHTRMIQTHTLMTHTHTHTHKKRHDLIENHQYLVVDSIFAIHRKRYNQNIHQVSLVKLIKNGSSITAKFSNNRCGFYNLSKYTSIITEIGRAHV